MDDSDILCVNGTHVHDVSLRGCEDVSLVYELFLTSLLLTHLCCVHERLLACEKSHSHVVLLCVSGVLPPRCENEQLVWFSVQMEMPLCELSNVKMLDVMSLNDCEVRMNLVNCYMI